MFIKVESMRSTGGDEEREHGLHFLLRLRDTQEEEEEEALSLCRLGRTGAGSSPPPFTLQPLN